MLASVIVQAVREALSDTESPYRHSDAELLRYTSRALRELFALHPESFWLDDFTVEPPEDVTATTDDIDSFDQQWTDAAVHHVCSKVLGSDAESEANRALAQYHWNLWKEEI